MLQGAYECSVFNYIVTYHDDVIKWKHFPRYLPLVTRSFDVYFDLRPNKRLSNQSWGWWFWRHRIMNFNFRTKYVYPETKSISCHICWNQMASMKTTSSLKRGSMIHLLRNVRRREIFPEMWHTITPLCRFHIEQMYMAGVYISYNFICTFIRKPSLSISWIRIRKRPRILMSVKFQQVASADVYLIILCIGRTEKFTKLQI